jgi:glyoxylase-like metal-dependent hydrolase (beta-lactamase superfamily II)
MFGEKNTLKKNNIIKYIRVGFTNCYILKCNGGFLLIDTGYPSDYDKFVEKLKKDFKIEVTDIKYLLLTHHHDDHSGFAAQLLKNSASKLIVHEKSIKQLSMGASEGHSKPINKRIKFVHGIFEKFHEFIFPPVNLTEKDIIIRSLDEDKEILKSIGIEGTIIFTPGHTNDGISIILSDGSVFCGDNSMNAWYFNILGIKKRPIFLQDIDLIFDSWKRYIELGGTMIYPSHGKSFKIQKLKDSLKKFNKMN